MESVPPQVAPEQHLAPPASAAGGAVPARPAFDVWVRPHVPTMHLLALRLAPRDADDVLQESLLRAWRAYATYDPGRGTPRAWLLTIVTNRARTSHGLRRAEPLALPDGLVTEDRHADTDLERAIAHLARRQRIAVTLHYLLGLPITEVAQVMGCSTGTVKSTLSDARRKLRVQLEETS